MIVSIEPECEVLFAIGALEAFDDMSEVAILYGFLSLFAFTCQIAPLLALINNLVE